MLEREKGIQRVRELTNRMKETNGTVAYLS